MSKHVVLWMWLGLAAAVGPLTTQAAVFKCPEAAGKVLFQDRPCEENAALTAAKGERPSAIALQSARNLVWKASAPGGTVYFMGSIHFGTPEMYPLSPAVTQAFTHADALVVEADVLAVDPQQLAGIVADKAMYQDGSTLQAALPPALWRRLTEITAGMGVPVSLLERQKPWFASMTLTALALRQNGFDEELGVDYHFLKLANQQRKRVIELESVKQQLDLFDRFSQQEQVVMLEQTLDDIARGPRFLREMLSAWKAGDETRLDDLLNEEYRTTKTAQRMYRILIVDRNALMAGKIADMLRRGGTYFVVVGAGHLVGKESVVNLLRGKGYQLEKL
ncbi:MAG: TraB/GumN family protein [Pseudomonadota bacterium]